MQAQQQPGPNEIANRATQQSSQPYAPSVAELHIASSNDTLNRFLGGTRRSWMLGAQPVPATPRPKKPKPQQPPSQPHRVPKQYATPSQGDPDIDNPQTEPRPCVLPSPAPSDEPSPAVSMTHDSPNSATATLPDAQSTSNPMPARTDADQLWMPVTEARFVVAPSAAAAADAVAGEGNQINGQRQNGYAAQVSGDPVTRSDTGLVTHMGQSASPVLRPSSTGQSTARARAGDIDRVHTPIRRGRDPPERQPPTATQETATATATAMSPPNLPQSGVTFPSMLLSSATSARSESAGTQPAAKKRRTEYLMPNASQHGIDLPSGRAQIRAYMVANGGLDAFTKDAEQPRLKLLETACQYGDVFFVALHQLSCLWTLNPGEAYRILALDHTVIDAGFYVVELVLKKNSLIHPRHLNWMAQFPKPLLQIIEGFQNMGWDKKYADAIYGAASFLKRAASSYSSLTQASVGRGYPYLVDELVGQLDCRSSSLQYVLFTASRRRLGVPDGQLGHSLDLAFFQDQNSHQDESGSFLPMAPIPDAADLEQRNAKLIQHYKHVVAQAKKARDEQRRRSSRNAMPSPNPEQPFPPLPTVMSSSQTRQSSVQHGQATSRTRAVTSSAQAPHLPRTSAFTDHPANQHSASQFSNPLTSQSSASSPVYLVPPPLRANMVLPSNSGTPQEGGQPPAQPTRQSSGQPSGHSSVLSSGQPGGPPPETHSNVADNVLNQQAAMYSWSQTADGHVSGQPSPGQMANQPMPGTPGSQGVYHQNPLPRQQGERPASNLHSFQPQPQASTQSPAFIHQLQRQYQLQRQTQQMAASQWELQQRQAQLAAELQRRAQASFPNPQTSPPTAMPTPADFHFPSGFRVQRSFTQPPVASPGLAPQMRSAADNAMRAATGQMVSHLRLQQQQQQQRQSAQGFDHMRFIPPPGQTIQLCDWPCDPTDKKSIMLSLHQANVRSPKRTARPSAAERPDERYYQAVKSLPVPPSRVAPVKRLFKYQFDVPAEQFARVSQTTLQAPGIPVTVHFDGSLRWRVRTCKLPPNCKGLAGMHEWVGMETAWPEHITMKLNGEHIAVRRRTHNGRDQPSELTPFIRQGINELAIAVAEPRKKTPDQQHALAVEIVETRSRSAILQHVWKHGVISEDETLSRIKSRLGTSHDDDDDSVQIVVKDLSIDLADPFSRVLFKIPARGAQCTHMECFDLETWLETRPSKTLKCPHSGFVPCNCNDAPEPSVADKWKCPICNTDARPYSLRIDSFLLGVRKRLEEEGKLRTKSILVAADGTWQPVVEEEDDDDDADSDDDDDGRANSAGANAKSGSAAPPAVTKKPVEVIELLDD